VSSADAFARDHVAAFNAAMAQGSFDGWMTVVFG